MGEIVKKGMRRGFQEFVTYEKDGWRYGVMICHSGDFDSQFTALVDELNSIDDDYTIVDISRKKEELHYIARSKSKDEKEDEIMENKKMTRQFVSVFGDKIELTVTMRPHKETNYYFDCDEVIRAEEEYWKEKGIGEEYLKKVESGKLTPYKEQNELLRLLEECRVSEYSQGETNCCDQCEWHESGGRGLCDNCSLILHDNVRLWNEFEKKLKELIEKNELVIPHVYIAGNQRKVGD